MNELIAYAAAVVVTAHVLVHVLFAIGLNAAANGERDRSAGPLIVGAGVWAFATLVGGPFVAGLYWVMHHSTLRPLGGRPVPETLA